MGVPFISGNYQIDAWGKEILLEPGSLCHPAADGQRRRHLVRHSPWFLVGSITIDRIISPYSLVGTRKLFCGGLHALIQVLRDPHNGTPNLGKLLFRVEFGKVVFSSIIVGWYGYGIPLARRLPLKLCVGSWQ